MFNIDGSIDGSIDLKVLFQVAVPPRQGTGLVTILLLL